MRQIGNSTFGDEVEGRGSYVASSRAWLCIPMIKYSSGCRSATKYSPNEQGPHSGSAAAYVIVADAKFVRIQIGYRFAASEVNDPPMNAHSPTAFLYGQSGEAAIGFGWGASPEQMGV